eukprot:scaffold11091_cov75-Phaeocystis_antarctica.AAC.12
MPFKVSDMPLSFTTDDAPQEDIERRRADRVARNRSRLAREEKMMFPNLAGEFDEGSPLEKHFSGKRDQ